MRSSWRKWGGRMNSRKAELAGTGKVFRFSLQQYFKSAATYVMFAVMLLGTVIFTVLMSTGLNRGEELESEAKAVWLLNGSPYTLDLAAFPDYVQPELTALELEEALACLDGGEKDSVAVDIRLDDETGLWNVTAYTGTGTVVTQAEALQLASCAAGALEAARYAAAGVSPGQIAVALAPVNAEKMKASEVRKPESEDMTTRQMVGSAYAILLFMLISFSTSFIVQAVMQEKTSKLVELLMVSVKPLALIAGKILAAMFVVAAGLMFACLGLAASRMVMGLLGLNAGVGMGFSQIVQGLNLVSLLVILVSVLLGYFSFAILAGISGASCATVSESSAAASAAMMVSMVGYIAGMSTSALKMSSGIRVMCVIPFFSVYVAPGRFLLGDIGFGLLALAWLLQAAMGALLAKGCAAVYGALLIHRGERIGLRQIIGMMRGERQI